MKSIAVGAEAQDKVQVSRCGVGNASLQPGGFVAGAEGVIMLGPLKNQGVDALSAQAGKQWAPSGFVDVHVCAQRLIDDGYACLGVAGQADTETECQ